MKYRVLSALALTAELAAPAYAQEPVDGAWDITADTPMGAFKSVLTFTPSGDSYTIDIADIPPQGSGAPGGGPETAAPGPSTISEVAVTSNAFSFKRDLQTPQGAMTLTYSGTVDGDALSGQAKSDFGDIPIKGTRKAN